MSIIPFRADLEPESDSSPDRESLRQLVTSCAARREEISVKLLFGIRHIESEQIEVFHKQAYLYHFDNLRIL